MISCGKYKLSWFPVIVAFLLICANASRVFAAEPLPKAADPPKLPPESMHGAGQDRLNLIAGVDFFYTLSDPDDSGSVSGGRLKALVAPTYKIRSDLMFICMYDGNYYKKLELYSDDVGPRERAEYQRHSLTPMLRMGIGENSRSYITPSLFYTQTYNKDIDSSSWDDGLYNYRDFGAGLDYEIKDFGRLKGKFKVGAQYYERHYSNYESLLDLATGLGVEKDEKDYQGIIARAGYGCIKGSGFSWSADYSLLYKMLDDKKVVNSQGILTSKKQCDYIHNLDFMVLHMLEKGIKIGLDLNYSLKDSNQNYYDGMGSLNPADHIFTSDFYNYSSYKFIPSISYTFMLYPITTSFSFSMERTDYTDRKAKYSDGAYKTKKQWETEKDILFDLEYEINKKWTALCRLQHVIFDSNNDDERVYKYDYKVNYYSVGASYKF